MTTTRFVPDRTKPAEDERARLGVLHQQANDAERYWDADVLADQDSDLFIVTESHGTEWADDGAEATR